MLRLKTIDAHAAGEPLRLIVDGFPSPRGKTMLAKREWVRANADHLRRALMLEPRGHADMYGAILTEPVAPGSHAGVLFMHNEGYSTMCGHGIIAVTTMALERGLLMPGRRRDHGRLRRARGHDSRSRANRGGRAGQAGGQVGRTGRERRVPQRAVVRAARRPRRQARRRGRFAPTSPSAAPSTRSSTARRSGCRLTRRTCRSCAAPAWRSRTPSKRR